MSSITEAERRYLEKILRMQDGFVLDFTDPTFGKFFRTFQIDIHGTKYQVSGSSKAKKLRSFWEQERDLLVGKVLSELLDLYEANCKLKNESINHEVLLESRKVAGRLLGKATPVATQTPDDYLHREFNIPNLQKLPIEAPVVPIIQDRLSEALKVLEAGAYLSAIILCGSVLEAVLLGAAIKQPRAFNQAAASPKQKDHTVKQFQEWTLAQLIDVAYEIQLIKLDDKKFSHDLRDFRNYIHPYHQIGSKFKPDEHTAKIYFQVLKATLASVAGER